MNKKMKKEINDIQALISFFFYAIIETIEVRDAHGTGITIL